MGSPQLAIGTGGAGVEHPVTAVVYPVITYPCGVCGHAEDSHFEDTCKLCPCANYEDYGAEDDVCDECGHSFDAHGRMCEGECECAGYEDPPWEWRPPPFTPTIPDTNHPGLW
jgi:hypothetical protein